MQIYKKRILAMLLTAVLLFSGLPMMTVANGMDFSAAAGIDIPAVETGDGEETELPEGYTLADGVSLPVITVGNGSLTPLATFINAAANAPLTNIRYSAGQPNITFAAQGSINLKSPVNLVFNTTGSALLMLCDFSSVRFESSPGRGYSLYPEGSSSGGIDGLKYDNTTGELTIPAAVFGIHASPIPSGGFGSPLPPGTYTAIITFKDGAGNSFDYYAGFTLSTVIDPGADALFTFNGNYANLDKIFLNNIELWQTPTSSTRANLSNYLGYVPVLGCAEEGSVRVTLYKEFLRTLPNGIYTLKVKFLDGTYGDLDFQIQYAPPATGNSSGGSGSGGGGRTSTSAPTNGHIICNTIKVPYRKAGGSLTISISEQTLRSIVDNAFKAEDGSKTVKLSYNDVSGSSGLTGLTLTFDASGLKADEDITFIIETPFGVFIFTTSQILEWFGGNELGSYTITLEKSSLKVDVKKNGVSAAWNSLTPMARIGVPLTLKTGERAANIAATDKNNRILPTSAFENGMVYADIFAPGTYKAVAATPAEFTDITGHWAKTSIDYVTLRGLISGTSSAAFAPDTAITRAEYLMALGKLSGEDVSGYKQSSFNDVANDNPAVPYIEWAVAKNIVAGIGGGRFAPDSPITREQMALMMANYAKALGYALPVTNNAAAYTDSASISAWAKDAVTAIQKADIMTGKDGSRFDPQGNTTRAESASILRRFVENVIGSRDAEGWSNASKDLSKRVYYTRNGVALTGWQTIDGDRYYFGSDGVMRTGWMDANGKRYCFHTNGKLIAGKWAEIDGKWYYFYEDGTLAVNTSIDSYTVDADGVRK